MRGVILRLVRIPLVILSALTRNKEVNMKWSRPIRWRRNMFAIDFETVAAGDYWGVRDFSDIWQIGITRLSDGKTKTWTVRPLARHMEHPYWEWYEYQKWNRLTKMEVESAPTLPEVYREILHFIGVSGILVGHNAFGFDKLAWEQTLQAHNLPLTSHKWMDTKAEYKKLYPGKDMGHRLMNMVDRYTAMDYVEENMHDAGEDAKALALVMYAVNVHPNFHSIKNWEVR